MAFLLCLEPSDGSLHQIALFALHHLVTPRTKKYPRIVVQNKQTGTPLRTQKVFPISSEVFASSLFPHLLSRFLKLDQSPVAVSNAPHLILKYRPDRSVRAGACQLATTQRRTSEVRARFGYSQRLAAVSNTPHLILKYRPDRSVGAGACQLVTTQSRTSEVRARFGYSERLFERDYIESGHSSPSKAAAVL
jgi:hypothetical protein